MSFDRGEIEGHRIERGGDRKKRLRRHTVIFFGMSFAVVCFILLFAGMGIAGASVTYDSGINTIFLEGGTNTLANMYAEINNPSVLSYDSGTNTYTISASISGKDNTPADLVLEDTTLIFDNTAANSYYIKTWRHLTIKNMIIKPADYDYIWHIHAYAQYGTPYSLEITDSDISGGWILAQPNGGWAPSTPTIIRNNQFHDTTMENHYMEYPLSLLNSAAENAYLYNNRFENIHITSGTYNGILGFNGCKDMTIDGLYIYDCSVNLYGMTYFYGLSDGARITNFEIKNCQGYGLVGKEYNKVTFANGVIRGVSNSGIKLYLSCDNGKGNFWIADVIIDDATTGIQTNPFTDITADIYNVRINDVGTAFTTYYTSVFYVTNSLATNYLKEYYIMENAEVRRYQLTDIYVTDDNGNPVESATVTIEAVAPDVSDYSINRKLESLTQTVTLSNGHTPLPNEDESKTVALLSRLVTHSTDKTYTYSITAEKDGYTATVTVDPDESWYREDPDTYPGVGGGTLNMVLPITGEIYTISGAVTDTEGTAIENAEVSDGTRLATTDENGYYTIADVPADTYTVTCTKEGYQDASEYNLVVSGGATTGVDFVLVDNIPPYTSGHSPAKDAAGVSRDTNIAVHILDEGVGIDQSSIV
ncbi:MAG: carboxypeptidase regulatory-like domain-containing protein, partial [Methanophagales archaeon]|nr:carboxypeptidase regulatory-like domain-containing protein [Methanophagales archaeon]